MNCVQCGAPVPDDARFCHSCGSQVSDAEGQARASGTMTDDSLKHVEDLLREDSSDEFTIHKLLGRGGMALVFLATETRLARKVAIKVLPPELTFGHGVERFMREAKMAAALDHPHIIPVYRIASGSKIFWYAMKFLEGRSLDEVLKDKGKLSVEETIHILGQVADALDYAHDHSVIHRDIKPANVMLDSRNRVIVTDFGIAKALTESNLTASGSVVGTPYYMSPEQGMGRGVTGRSDQYSVAVMAYRMISGQVPFEGDSAIDILHKHCMVAAPRMEAVLPGLAPHVYKAIHKALEKKPELRFSSVSAFVEALKRPTADLDVSSEAATLMVPSAAITGAAAGRSAAGPPRVSQPPTPPTPIPTGKLPAATRPTRRRAPVVVGIAAAAVLGVGGWLLFLRPEPPATAPTTEAAPPQPSGVTTGAQNTPPTQAPVTPPEAPAAPTTGRVTVTGLPTGGSITADGARQSGSTFELPPGRHQLRLSARGYSDVTVPITVAAGERQTVAFTGQRVAAAERRDPPATRPREAPPTPPPGAAAEVGIIQVLIRPWANLTIDGRSYAQQSRFADTLLAGNHQMRFERAGFVTKDTVITLRAGQTVTLRIDMQPRNPD